MSLDLDTESGGAEHDKPRTAGAAPIQACIPARPQLISSVMIYSANCKTIPKQRCDLRHAPQRKPKPGPHRRTTAPGTPKLANTNLI